MLNYGAHQIDEDDIAAVTAVLRGSRLTQGPEVIRFEQALAKQLGAAGVCVVSNGTAALHLAYAALGLGPGDEIITSPITFVATANAARLLGAEVLFADVDPETGNLDPAAVERLISPRTRGIVPVHLGGLPVDLTRILALAEVHNLWTVEDAAHALGASYNGNSIGGVHGGDAATFSFHPVKHITTAEGGAVSVRDPRLLPKLHALREHGLTRATEPDAGGYYQYEQHSLGYNYRLSDVQCALGTSQLAKLPQWVRQRRALAKVYRQALAETPHVQLQGTTERGESSYHLMMARIDYRAAGVTRDLVRQRLSESRIAPQVHYPPVCDQPYYRERYGLIDCPNARVFFDSELSLPLHAGMVEDDVWRVANALKIALRQSPRAQFNPTEGVQT